MWPRPVWSEESVICFSLKNVFLTNNFVPIDLSNGLLFINQTYASLKDFLPPTILVEDGAFQIEAAAQTLSGKYAVIGGPVDGNWWHWLFNWCPRLLLLKRLRPDLFYAKDVKFIVHPLAMVGSFRAILDTFEISLNRIIPLDASKGYILEEAILVSFLNQEMHYPVIMHAHARQILRSMRIEQTPCNGRRLFASRQDHPRARRRIRNFSDVSPILNKLNFEAWSFGDLSARDQVQLFHDAEIVAGVHGSDFTGVVFCRPGTKVVVFEPERNVKVGLHYGLEWLCKLFYLDYRRIVVAEVNEGGGSEPTEQMLQLNRDVVLDSSALRQLESIVNGINV